MPYYSWPASALGPSEMALLFRARQKNPTRTTITKLLAAAVRRAYGTAHTTPANEQPTARRVPQPVFCLLALTAAILLAGCGNGTVDQVIENLTQENLSLQGQIDAADTILGIMAVVLTITGVALAVTLAALGRRKK